MNLEAAADGGAGEVILRTAGSYGDGRLYGLFFFFFFCLSLVQFCCLNVLQT